MRRALVLLGLVLGLVAAAPASAHPLGNFSVNHLSVVRVSDDRVDVRYVLDQAEIPTARERGMARADVLAAKRDEVARGLDADGRRAARAARAGRQPAALVPRGRGRADTTRLELSLSARVSEPRRVELRDDTFPGRVGWKAVVAAPGEGTAVRSSAPSGDPTGGLRRYPEDLLNSPRGPARGELPRGAGRGHARGPEGRGRPVLREPVRGQRGLREAVRGRRLRPGRAPAAAPRRLRLGRAPRALARPRQGDGGRLSGGHPGRPRHAVALGATVTVTHTIGVFALGVVTLALSQYVLAEDLYPWLTLVSGLMVLGVGAAVLRTRFRHARAHAHGSHHHHGHSHDITTTS